MSKHVAFFASPDLFESIETRAYAPGITLRTGARPGSKTREGFAYEFAASEFSDDEARAWMREKKIPITRLDFSAEEPRFGSLEMEALEEGEHTDKNGRVLNATREYIAQLAANTTRLIREGKLTAPVKLGHDPDQSSVAKLFPEGGEPALGYLSEALVRGNRIAVSATHVPRKFVQAVKDKLWSKTSAEIHPNYRGEGPAIVGIACLGATRPAIPTLAEIYGFDAASLESALETLSLLDDGQATPCFLLTVERAVVEAATAPGGPDAQDGENETKTNPETTDPPNEDETMSEELKARIATLEADGKAQLEAAKKAVADTLEFCVGDTIEPGQLAAEHAIAMQFSTPEQVKNYVSSVRQRAKVKDRSTPLGGGASGDTPPPKDTRPPDVQLSERATKRAREEKITYDDAFLFEAQADPALYNAYRKSNYRLISAGEREE